MSYRVIFTSSEIDDTMSLTVGYRSDVILQDEKDDYYEINFITLERIRLEFEDDEICYLESNMVILHLVTKKNILNAIPEMIKWKFCERVVPLSSKQLESFYFPKTDWEIFEIEV